MIFQINENFNSENSERWAELFAKMRQKLEPLLLPGVSAFQCVTVL